jgi:hypothetical protein
MYPRSRGVGFSHESITMSLGDRLGQRIVHTLVLNGLLFHYGCRGPTINSQKWWSADVFTLFYCSPYLGPKGDVGTSRTFNLVSNNDVGSYPTSVFSLETDIRSCRTSALSSC